MEQTMHGLIHDDNDDDDDDGNKLSRPNLGTISAYAYTD
jgi:hypothetical protein